MAAPRRSLNAASALPPDSPIIVRGARVHNLKNVSCDIPARALTVITGVSGSGKSSLAFDTLYAEGQRRYVESLSAYARQFLERMEKPDVDSVEGLYPAVAVEQRIPAKGKRSTVGTATEVSDHLRLLFARIGRPMCPEGHGRIARKSVADVLAFAQKELPLGARLFLTYPLPLPNNAPSADVARELKKEGYRRAFVDGRLTEVDAWPEETLTPSSRVLVVADRVETNADEWARFAESIEACMKAGRGWVVLRTAEGNEYPFSEHFLCDTCGKEAPNPDPPLFSFNHPQGACPACKGFGNVLSLDERKIVPDPSLSLEDGAIEPWDKESREDIFLRMLAFARANGVRTNVPYKNLTERERSLIWEGETKRRRGGYPGIEGFFARLQAKSYKLHVRVYISRYRRYTDCAPCGGARLRAEALWFRVGGKNIAEVSVMTVDEARMFLKQVEMTHEERAVARKVLEESEARLRYLHEVGLGYLTLDRLASTLSGGEAQRIMLATLLGAALTGTMMVLDEPTVGLHPRDTERLLGILTSLRDTGNSLVIVEHDRAVIERADHVIELGPGAGGRGGEIVASETAEKFRRADTLTAAYLRGEKHVPRSRNRRQLYRPGIVLRGIRLHNLRGATVDFPWGGLVAVTGVSGSGKSTLVRDVLLREYNHFRETRGKEKPLFCDAVENFDRIYGVTAVDQSPLGRSARSNALTITGALAPIRALFAATPDARALRLDAGHFSFNSPKGRCPACEGLGTTEVDMQFMANVRLVCDVCEGTGFQKRVLKAAYRGHSIRDVMEMTADEAVALFGDRPEIMERLAPLREAGLGYLRLGQPTSTLSGGESQRLKIASALGNRRVNTLYIFDEPTTGLHLDDVAVLLDAFSRLLDRGNTLIVIEHHMDVVKNADWVIDMGPEAGGSGGRVVAEGTPEDVAKARGSHTAKFLREALAT